MEEEEEEEEEEGEEARIESRETTYQSSLSGRRERPTSLLSTILAVQSYLAFCAQRNTIFSSI